MITLTNGVQVPENAVQLQTTAAIDGYYVTQPLRLVQYDQTLPVAAVQLTYQNQPYTPPTGAELNVRMVKSDGTTVYNPCLGVDSSGIVYFVFTQQMTAAAGDGKLTVEVTDSGVKNSAPIIVNVAENPVQEGSIESTDEFLTLQEILAEAEKWGQIVQANASNIQQVVDNLEDIQNAAENAQAAAASAAAAQQAAQEALGFRTFFSAVRPDKSGNLDPSRPMTVGPAASLTIESKGDRIQSVTALGFTQQAGTGDPSPTNVRALTNGGLKLYEVELKGTEPWTQLGGQLTWVGIPVPGNTDTKYAISNVAKFQYSYAGNCVFIGGASTLVFGSEFGNNYTVDTWKSMLAAQYAAGTPVIVWYAPADESDATGLYAPIIIEGGEYRATCLPLTAPLCDGDSVVSWVKSGCDKAVPLSSLSWVKTGSGTNTFSALISGVTQNQAYSDAYPFLPTVSTAQNCISVNNAGVFVTDLSCASVEDLQSKLAQSGAQLWYRSTNYTPATDIPVSLETHAKAVAVLDGTTTATRYDGGNITVNLPAGSQAPKETQAAECEIAKYQYSAIGSGFYPISNGSIGFGSQFCADNGWSTADICKSYLSENPTKVVYPLATPITYAHPAVVLEAATGEQLTYTVTGQSGGTVSVALKPFQDGGHAKTADNAANAQNATKFDGHAWSEVSGQAPVQSVNGKTGAVTLAAADVGAAAATFVRSGSFNDIKAPGVYYLANAVTDKPGDVGGLYILQYVHEAAAVGLYCPVNGTDIYKVILPGTSSQLVYKFTGTLV